MTQFEKAINVVSNSFKVSGNLSIDSLNLYADWETVQGKRKMLVIVQMSNAESDSFMVTLRDVETDKEASDIFDVEYHNIYTSLEYCSSYMVDYLMDKIES